MEMEYILTEHVYVSNQANKKKKIKIYNINFFLRKW